MAGNASNAAPDAAHEAVNFLEEDPITVPGQLFALVSFVSPEGRQRNDKCGLKIRGVFGTRAEADSHAKKLQKLDPLFDIYLVDMYRWLLVPPDPNAVEDQEYQEEFLNDLVKGYKESQALAKRHFEERKRAVMEQGLDANLLPEERMPPPAAPEASTSSLAALEKTLETDPHPASNPASK